MKLTRNTRINGIMFAGKNDFVLASGNLNMTFGEYMDKSLTFKGLPTGIEGALNMEWTAGTRCKDGNGNHTLQLWHSPVVGGKGSHSIVEIVD